MARVKTRDRRDAVPAGAQRGGQRRRVVADGAEQADAGDGGLVARALALERFAENLDSILPGRRFERGGVSVFLHLKKFAPDADELFAQLVRRHVLRRGDDVRSIVARPLEIKNPLLAQHPLPVRRTGKRRENEKLGGVDVRRRQQIQRTIHETQIVPVAAHADGREEADVAVFGRFHEVNQHLPLAFAALQRADGHRLDVHRAVEIFHAGAGGHVKKCRPVFSPIVELTKYFLPSGASASNNFSEYSRTCRCGKNSMSSAR